MFRAESPQRHLAEIFRFFGPFPKRLPEKGNQDLVREVFDKEGRVKTKHQVLTGPDLGSQEWMPGLASDLSEKFESFLCLLMRIDPEDRPTPEIILRHPWLDGTG
jgi:serine/threonine-protein kinase SRPK3